MTSAVTNTFLTRHSWIRPTTYTLLALVIFAFFFGPHSGQIRLDTGDLRYCWLGIPLQYEQMPEPERSKLLALASKPPAVSSTWITCATYPLPTSNNPDSMCRSCYSGIAAWTDEDPHIARWALDDMVTYLQDTHATHGLPKSCELVVPGMIDYAAGKVEPNWRDEDAVKDYCTAHAYTPSPKLTTRPTR
jgi:hypothetical protein